jgi:Effector-associated domain 1
MDGTQRQKLHSALMDAFPDVKALEQMVSFQLNLLLSSVTTTKDLSEATFELIKWTNAQGRISDLVEGAHKQNPGNPELREFYLQDWQQLKSETELYVPSVQQLTLPNSNRDTAMIVKGSDELVVTEFSPILTSIQNISTTPPPPISTEIPVINIETTLIDLQKGISLAQEHCRSAEKFLEYVWSLFQSDTQPGADQCSVAIQQVKEADNTVQKTLVDLARVAAEDVPHRYQLESNVKYFSETARKVITSIQVLSNRSAPRSENISDKINALKQSLQDIGNLVDMFGQQWQSNQIVRSDTREQ